LFGSGGNWVPGEKKKNRVFKAKLSSGGGFEMRGPTTLEHLKIEKVKDTKKTGQVSAQSPSFRNGAPKKIRQNGKLELSNRGTNRDWRQHSLIPGYVGGERGGRGKSGWRTKAAEQSLLRHLVSRQTVSWDACAPRGERRCGLPAPLQVFESRARGGPCGP